MTEKSEEHSVLKSMDSKGTETAEIALSVAEENHQKLSPPLSPCHDMRRMEQELLGEVLMERKMYDGRQRNVAPIVEQRELLMTGAERSMTKEELKEKLELFQERVMKISSL